jgi:hypothetical protein
VSQALKGDSNDIAKLLNVSLDLIGSDVPASDKERSVEVLAFLATKTKVKEELGECAAAAPLSGSYRRRPRVWMFAFEARA